MVSHNIVKGMKMPKSSCVSFCEECVEAKIFKKSYKPLGEICLTGSFNVCMVMYVDLNPETLNPKTLKPWTLPPPPKK